MKFRHQFSPKYVGSKGKKLDDTLITVPDLSLSVKELLQRHSRGLGLGTVEMKGEYFDEIIPNIQDLTDAHERREALRKRFQEVDEKIRDEKNEKEKAKKQAEYEALKKKVMEDIQQEQKPQENSPKPPKKDV